MADVSIIIKIAGVGILISIMNMVLKQADKEEQAQLLTLARRRDRLADGDPLVVSSFPGSEGGLRFIDFNQPAARGMGVEILFYLGLCLVAVVLLTILRQDRQELAVMLSMVVGIIILTRLSGRLARTNQRFSVFSNSSPD